MNKLMRTTAWIAVLLCTCLLVAGCANTAEDFRKVQTGWSLDQVRDLLGEPDKMSETGGLAAVWVYKSGGLFGDGSTLTINALAKKVVLTAIEKK